MSIYYNVVMSYVVFFFYQSFTLGPLPWSSCNNYWNTPDCLDVASLLPPCLQVGKET